MPDLADLRHEIEDLTLRLVVADSAAVAADWWIAPLERIRDNAVACRAGRVAGVAAEAIDLLRGTRPIGESDAGLQNSITRLQQALDMEGHTFAPELSLAHDPELLSDFVLESREHLAAVESQLLRLEKNPADTESLNAIFRGFHTLKGLAGFLELWEVQKLAHEVETILDLARNLEIEITPAAIDVVLESADYLRRWLTHLDSVLQNKPTAAPARDEPLLARIHELSASPPFDPPAPEAVAPLPPPGAVAEGNTPVWPEPGVGQPRADAGPAQSSECVPEPPNRLAQIAAIPAVETSAPGERSSRPPAGSGPQAAEAMAVKVNTAKLDYLVDMAGEMVIAESLVRHDPDLATVKSPRLQRNLAQLTRITSELQRTSMSMRLVPIGPLFRRMARLVRDLSRQFGKIVQMETQGDDIELDRNIVEELADPLMHMVRNSLDHGIEAAAERVERGKPATARLLLRAQHQAGQVVIEIADDGRGLDRQRIVAKAIERALITSGDGLTDTEVHNLIFEPGFSTAAQVTSVSGRGVGMDVVRRHIEKLRGRIEIRSTAGKGAIFTLKLPLTLAIIDGLVVAVGQERYIVPLFAVREMFRPHDDTIWTVQQKSEMALVRESLLPVLRLYRKFGVTPRSDDPRESVLVVAESEGQRFCLVVDQLIGKQEVVIKSLGETFKNVTGIAGGAILGDGRVGLILDLDRLLRERNAEAVH